MKQRRDHPGPIGIFATPAGSISETQPKRNGGVRANSAIPARALLRADQGYAPRVIRKATASERPSVGPGRARDKSLRASPYGFLASTSYRLTMNLATNQRAQRRDRTNVYMCHLDHLL